MSSKEVRTPLREDGFTLVEVLVALVVAAVLLGTVGRVFATAWTARGRPAETLAAFAAARQAVTGSSPSGRLSGFLYERRSLPIELIARPSPLAPAPLIAPKPDTTDAVGNTAMLRGLAPQASFAPSAGAVAASPILAGLTPPGVSRAGNAARAAPLRLRLVTVTVLAPSHHRFSWSSVRNDAGAP